MTNTTAATSFIIRPARSADARGIAIVHVRSWQSTYRGIVPQTVLDNMSSEQRTAYWQTLLDDSPSREFVLVAETEPGDIVGFASGGPERTGHPAYRAELYAIYLLETAQRQGLGKCLVSGMAALLADRGYESMLVWVLAANPARRFYEALGGQPVLRQPISIGGAELEEVAYGWPSLIDLSHRRTP